MERPPFHPDAPLSPRFGTSDGPVTAPPLEEESDGEEVILRRRAGSSALSTIRTDQPPAVVGFAPWENPGAIDSAARNFWDVVLSMMGTARGIGRTLLSCFWPWYRPDGDGLIRMDGDELALREWPEFMRIHRVCTNQLQLATADQIRLGGGLRLPEGVQNFVQRDTPVCGEEQCMLTLQLPDAIPDRILPDRDRAHILLAHLSRELQDMGFVAYKNNMLILHPPSHMACVIVYDAHTEQFAIHFRDTASDGCWEEGSAANWGADIRQGMGLVPENYAMADFITQRMGQILGPGHLILAGYSMGGGIALFCGLRYLLRVVAMNAAAPSRFHGRFFPEHWQEFAAGQGGRNMVLVGCSDDILSGILDNSATGGILPTAFPRGMRYYPFAVGDGRGDGTAHRWLLSVASLFARPIHAHYLSELVLRQRRAAEMAEHGLEWEDSLDWLRQDYERLYAAGTAAEIDDGDGDMDGGEDDREPLLLGAGS